MNKRFLGLIIAVTFSLLMTVLSTSCNTKPMTISKAVDRDKECLCEISNEYFLGQIDALENALLAMIQIDSSIVDFETVKKEIDEYREKVLNLTEIPNNIVEDFSILQKELLLKNPKFKFSDVLCRETKNGSMPANWVGNSEIDKTGYGNRIISFKFQNSLKEKEIYKPKGSSAFVGDIVPSFNGEKFLYSSISDKKNWEVFEFDLITEQERQVSTETFSDIDNYNGCYLPDDRIIYCSTATMVGVPCVGGVDYVANLYIMDNNGENIRQLTYEQDADWYPTVMNSGKIMYLRWEYTDLAHYFTRIMMSMNPDGTAQKALYGTNSYWPNSMFYSKPLPGNDRRFVSIVTGHHGTERAGELILFDTSLGEKEAEGAVIRLGAVTKDVNPAIMDELVEKIWPKYLHPYPLTDNSFLVASKTGPKSNWAIYLVDTYGNRVLIKEKKNLHLLEPVPIMSREVPPIIPDKVDLTKKVYDPSYVKIWDHTYHNSNNVSLGKINLKEAFVKSNNVGIIK
ncbi:MAG: hypothetical protein KAH04_07880, partial [Psychrilyobacter sp.]|nr:hypothetical protein [Psychrilyobacter sp.]